MFGLKKCSEEDFHEFVYSNSRYHPDEIHVSLIGALFGILIFLGIAYIYLVSLNIECPYLISMIIKIFIVGDIFFIILSWINKQKYAFMLQKFMAIIIGINWFVFSIVMYPGPLILSYYENKDTLFSIIIYMMIIGFIYLIFVFTKLIILIKKGEMGKGSIGMYERLFSEKIVYLGFSVPIIVIASKFARRLTIEMDNSGFDIGPLILMLVFAFIIQLALSSIIPECIILAYCKFRFESFDFSYELYSARGKKRKKLMKQAERERIKKNEENEKI